MSPQSLRLSSWAELPGDCTSIHHTVSVETAPTAGLSDLTDLSGPAEMAMTALLVASPASKNSLEAGGAPLEDGPLHMLGCRFIVTSLFGVPTGCRLSLADEVAEEDRESRAGRDLRRGVFAVGLCPHPSPSGARENLPVQGW